MVFNAAMDRRNFLKTAAFMSSGLFHTKCFLSQIGSHPSCDPQPSGLDQIVADFAPGELIIIGGVNTSLLKSALRSEILHRAALVHHKPVVVLDYGNLIYAADAEERFQTLWQINRRLGRVSHSRSHPVVVITSTFAKPNRALTISDMRHFSGLDQVADKILFLHRSRSGDHANRVPLTLSVAKNRRGPIGVTTTIYWDHQLRRFS